LVFLWNPSLYLYRFWTYWS